VPCVDIAQQIFCDCETTIVAASKGLPGEGVGMVYTRAIAAAFFRLTSPAGVTRAHIFLMRRRREPNAIPAGFYGMKLTPAAAQVRTWQRLEERQASICRLSANSDSAARLACTEHGTKDVARCF
jgi:hypothetical protein